MAAAAAGRSTPLIIDGRCENDGLEDIAGSRGVFALIIFVLKSLLLKLLKSLLKLLALLLASMRRRGCLCFTTEFVLTGW